jgi:DNA-binding PadR family transcriptional regulator
MGRAGRRSRAFPHPEPPEFPFGPGPWVFGASPRHHRRARRGLLRESILVLLGEQPRNGYQIITALSERTMGDWKPSPGAVYPCLQQLTDEGLVEPVDLDGQKAFQLTDAGREALADAPTEPWSSERCDWNDWVPERVADLRLVFDELKQFAKALRAVATDASPEQLKVIAADIAALKRKLYATLAEPPAED